MKYLMYEDNNDHVQLYDNVSAEILTDAAGASSRMGVLLEDLSFQSSLKEVFNELTDACAPQRISQIIQHRRIERKARMFLSEFAVFTNHWDKRVKRQDGKNGLYANLLKKVVSEAYDSCEEYMFCCHLRNYALHGGDVVSRIHGYIDMPYVQPLANKDFLLKNYSKWKAIDKTYLSKQADYFDLLPIFEKSLDAVKNIHEHLMDFQLSEATIADCDKLINLHALAISINSNPGFWDIIEFYDKDGNSCLISEISDPVGSCGRYYINWDVYPLIKLRAQKVIEMRDNFAYQQPVNH